MLLKKMLADKGITLRVLIGKPTTQEALKRDEGVLPWAELIPTYYFGKLCWQPCEKYTSEADLVITAQENKLIYNHLLLLRKKKYRLAFWGHGANMQSNSPNGLKEKYKRWSSQKVDWWFAYTKISLDLVSSTGFQPQKITNLENAIDTTSLENHLKSITEDELETLRDQLGWQNSKIGIFIGSLYSDKRLNFLLESALELHTLNSEFKLLIIGDGPDRCIVTEFCSKYSWCIWVGAQTGRDKAKYLALADVCLNPGLVGLGILDSFVAKVPIVTTECGLHSPEIAYLQQNNNGLITNNSVHCFVEGVRKILYNTEYRLKILNGCTESAAHYTVENMAQNFLTGILNALEIHKN